jgi:hypothetical protein
MDLGDAVVSVSLSDEIVGQWQSFDVAIVVDPAVDIIGMSFDLSFDATLLQANSVMEGDLLNQGCGTIFLPGTINNTTGTITGVAGSTTYACTVSSPGTFANINFTARNVSGTSFIDMSSVAVSDVNALPVSTSVINGGVSISQHGDINGDGHIDLFDLVRIGLHWGETGTPGWIPEDVTPDGIIDLFDLVIIGINWNG